MSSIQAQLQALGGLKKKCSPPHPSPCFLSVLLLLFSPPLMLLRKSSLPSLPLLRTYLSVSSSLALSPSLSLSLDLIPDCLCQLFCWCFLPYFHLTLFCRAYQGLLTAPAVRYLSTVYLSEAFSHHYSGGQLACLVRPWIL